MPTHSRPTSPHLTIWKWGPHMLVSILHRMTGGVLALAGTTVFVWWLAAMAGGAESYAVFHQWAIARTEKTWLTFFVMLFTKGAAIGLSWAFFQHLANGVRHLFMDMGAGYELKRTRATSISTIVFSVVATLTLWAYIFAIKGVA